MLPQNFGQKFVDALIHLVNAILKILLFPLTFWVKSLVSLAEKKKPIYDPTVGLNWELLYDGVMFLAYPLGVLLVLVGFIQDLGNQYLTFVGSVEHLLVGLFLVYLSPVAVFVAKYVVKLAWAIILGAWNVICTLVKKIYHFIVNPHWHIAIHHIHEEKK